jgi:hypothetical protein
MEFKTAEAPRTPRICFPLSRNTIIFLGDLCVSTVMLLIRAYPGYSAANEFFHVP